MRIARRTLMTAAAASSALRPARAQSSRDGVKLALLVPLSGPWARQGELKRLGAAMAVEDVNKAGGIRSLGGRPLTLVISDAGESTERAASAAQRLVATEPELVAGIGAWLSSFTLAVTEVTERARLPWLTLSFADSVTERGFRYIIATSAQSSRIVEVTMPILLDLATQATGKRPGTLTMVADSTAVAQAFVNPLRQGGLNRLQLRVVADETFTPPLSDATPLVQRIRTSRPDFVLLYTSNVPDAKLLLEKMGEFGLGRGRVPILAPGAQMGVPELLSTLGAENLEGVISVAANWGSRTQQALLDEMCRRTKEPWITQDTLSAYGQVMLVADALERSATINRESVMEALRATDTSSGPARYFLGDRLRFDVKGRRIDAPVAMYQWQKGVPVTVSPDRDAFASLAWPRRQS